MSSVSTQDRDKVEEAVKYFSKFIDSKPKLSNTVEVHLNLVLIEEKSVSSGLSANHLSTLVDVAACGNLAQRWSVRLIKALIPKTVVPESAVMKAVSWMCTNKPPVVIQSLLIRWLLVVYDYIEEVHRLQNLYGILFYFLDNQILLPHVCHLLYLLTRKDDVHMFRVHKLLQLQKQMGTQPYLTGLLSIYQVYYPNLVTLPSNSTNIIFFKSVDRNWTEIVRKVQDQNETSPSHCTKSKKKPADVSTSAPASKRKRKELIPKMTAQGSGVGDRNVPPEQVLLSLDVVTVPMIQINSFMDMVDKIGKIQIPSQIATALRDPVLQHIIAYSGDKVMASRFTYWIQHTLVEELLNTSGYNEAAEKLLQHLICFMDFLQEGIPVVDRFLHMYLLTWNGVDYRPYIMRLIGKSRMYSGPVLRENVLEPLRKLFFTSSVYFKCQVILALTKLTENYAALEFARYKDCLQQQDTSQPNTHFSLFHEKVETFDPLQTMHELVKFVLSVAQIGLIAENDHTLLMYHVISYIELLSTLNQKYDVPFLFLPSSLLISRIILNNSALACSKLCSILCNYRASFQALRAWSEQSNKQSDCFGLDQVKEFNGIVIDVCNCFFRNKLYDTTLGLGVSMKKLVVDVSDLSLAKINGSLSIYQHAAFAGFVKTFLKQTQPQVMNLSEISETQSLKQAYLEYLKKEGLSGVVEFTTTFLRKHSTSN